MRSFQVHVINNNTLIQIFLSVDNCISISGLTITYGVVGISSAGYNARGSAAVCTFNIYNRSE